MKADRPGPLRGQVFEIDIGHGRKPFVIVSSNARNQALRTALAVRITTAPKPAIPSIVALPAGEPLVGRALCDDIVLVERNELTRLMGGLSSGAMTAIGAGLRAALAL